jgi:hypothetical protein
MEVLRTSNKSLTIPQAQEKFGRVQQRQQRIFLVLSTAFQALSSIPPLKICTSILSRSIIVISTVINIQNNERSSFKGECSKKVTRIQHVARLVILAVGILGMGLASTPISLVSTISNQALLVFGMIKATYDDEGPRVLFLFNALVMSGLGLGATLTGSWTIVFAMATLNVAMKVISAVRAALSSNDSIRFVNVGCNITQGAFGIMRVFSAIPARIV